MARDHVGIIITEQDLCMDPAQLKRINSAFLLLMDLFAWNCSQLITYTSKYKTIPALESWCFQNNPICSL